MATGALQHRISPAASQVGHSHNGFGSHDGGTGSSFGPDDGVARQHSHSSQPQPSEGGSGYMNLKFMSCVMYGAASVSASFVAKGLFGVYGFKYPFVVLSLQMAVTMAVIHTAKRFQSSLPFPLNVPDVTSHTIRAVAPQSALFVLNVVVGFLAMARVNIPLFLCLRRTSLLFVLAGEYVLLQKTHSSTVIGCVGLMVLGALIAGWDGLTTAGSEASVSSFAFVIANNACTALYLLYSKKFTNANKKMSALSLVYLQSMVGLPLTLACSLFTGELGRLSAFEFYGDSAFWALLFTSCFLGICVCFTVVMVNTYNSPLVMSITGSVKDVVATSASMMLFMGFQANVTSISGILISLIGSTLYSVNAAKNKAAAAAPVEKTSEDDAVV